MTTAPSTSTAPDETRTRNHAQAETLRKIADFLDANPTIQTLDEGPMWVFARDQASAVAWREFLGNPPVKVEMHGAHKARCEARLGGFRFILAMEDKLALAAPVPEPAPQVAEWLR